jgi:hypothetical protein
MPADVTYSLVRIGEDTQVTCSTSLPDVVWWCWYLDGTYVGKTRAGTRTFHLPAGEQVRLEAVPTDEENYDPIANAPIGYSARRTLWWIRSLTTDAAQYRIDQRKGTDEWSTLALIGHDDDRWDYSLLTGRLDDLADYTWRIVPIDAAGNEGGETLIGPERIVRTPDAPNFSTAFDPQTTCVEFDLA